MTRATLILASDPIRHKAAHWCAKLPINTRVEFKAPKRTVAQNSRLWPMLTDIATQLTWHGARLSTEDWKTVFMASLKSEMRIVPNIDGNGFVNLGRSSSDLSKEEFSALIEIITVFGVSHGVVFHDPANSPLEREVAA